MKSELSKEEIDVPIRELIRLTRDRSEELVKLIAIKTKTIDFKENPNYRIVLTGGTSNLFGLEKLIANNITSNVRTGNPKDNLTQDIKINNLPEELIVVSIIESGLDPKAVSRAKAVGLWQFMYSTGKQYGLERTWYVDERQDIFKSTEAAVEYFKDLYKEFEDWYLVLAAYNTGPGRVNRAVNLHETSDYWQLSLIHI